MLRIASGPVEYQWTVAQSRQNESIASSNRLAGRRRQREQHHRYEGLKQSASECAPCTEAGSGTHKRIEPMSRMASSVPKIYSLMPWSRNLEQPHTTTARLEAPLHRRRPLRRREESQGSGRSLVSSRYGSPAKLQVYIASKPCSQDPDTFELRLQVGSQQSSMVVDVVCTELPRWRAALEFVKLAEGTRPVRAVKLAGHVTTL